MYAIAMACSSFPLSAGWLGLVAGVDVPRVLLTACDVSLAWPDTCEASDRKSPMTGGRGLVPVFWRMGGGGPVLGPLFLGSATGGFANETLESLLACL